MPALSQSFGKVKTKLQSSPPSQSSTNFDTLTRVDTVVFKGPKRRKKKSNSPPKFVQDESATDEKACEVDVPILDKYKISERLGKGAYGIVWDALELKTNRRVALKKLFDAFRNNSDAQRTYREVIFLLEFGSHPNIISVTAGHKALNGLDFYLAFPLMSTDLHKVIKNSPEKLTNREIRSIFYEICKALLFIHSANVIHRDLKPANILLDKENHVKLADFGLARTLSSSTAEKGDGHPEMTDYVATRWYRPPELLLSYRRYTKAIDIWGLVCILAEMLNKRALFPGGNQIEQIDLVIGTILPPTRDEVECFTTSTSITSVIQASILNRKPSIAELFKDHGPNVIDLLEKTLVFSPENRFTIEEVLDHVFLKWDRIVWEETRYDGEICPGIQDSVRYPLETYRSTLYKMVDRGEIGSEPQFELPELKRKPFSTLTLPSKISGPSADHGGGGDCWSLSQKTGETSTLDRMFDERALFNINTAQKNVRDISVNLGILPEVHTEGSIVHNKLKPDMFVPPTTTSTKPKALNKTKLLRPIDFKLKMLEAQKRLEEMNVKSYDPEKGDWPMNPSVMKRTTTFRSVVDGILQSTDKGMKKSSKAAFTPFPENNTVLLTFEDERPVWSRGKKPSTATPTTNITGYHCQPDIQERPWTHLELDSSTASINFLEQRSRAQSKRTVVTSKLVKFRPEIEIVQKPRFIPIVEKTTVEKNREKLKHSSYFPGPSQPEPSTQLESVTKFLPTKPYVKRDLQRCRITGNAKIVDTHSVVLGLLRQEPPRPPVRPRRSFRPSTQPQSTGKSMNGGKGIGNNDKLPRSVNAVVAPLPGNYGTISSKALDELKATFQRVGRY